ncbi:hypothetical protein EDC01DRAFT_640130 [Geopyxis carbonaria]|nr:hypothetical protein EDC01DRAFT_640130 [Geopyxis carbonaria]
MLLGPSRASARALLSLLRKVCSPCPALRLAPPTTTVATLPGCAHLHVRAALNNHAGCVCVCGVSVWCAGAVPGWCVGVIAMVGCDRGGECMATGAAAGGGTALLGFFVLAA